MRFNKELALNLAEETEMIFNLEMIPAKLHPWHRKRLYNFVEAILKNAEELQKEPEKQVA